MSTLNVFERQDRFRHFNEHLEQVPIQWRGPIADVIDTYQAVRIGLRQFDKHEDDMLVLALTRIVLDRNPPVNKEQLEEQNALNLYDRTSVKRFA